MSEKRTVVRWDFDGFITDPWAIFRPFFYTYTGILANETGENPREMEGAMKRGAKIVRSNPGRYGWEIYQADLGKKVVVAPAEGDPYMFTKAAAQFALKEFRPTSEKTKTRIPTGAEVPDFLNKIFLLAYPAITVPVRPGAKEAIEKVHRTTDFAFMSNSETINVREKLLTKAELFRGNQELGNEIRIFGDAKKQKIDPRFTKVPPTIRLKGVPRPIYLRRGQYLRQLIEAHANLTGDDIPEFGLFAAALLRINGGPINTILMQSDETPQYAIHFFNMIKGGHVVKTPLEAAQVVEKFGK